jgi:hypothetical protein
MSWVDNLGALDALGAVIPVWAVQALVAHTVDELIAAIADSRVAYIATGIAKELGNGWKSSVFDSGLEGVSGMMTVLVLDMAFHAEIVVIAGHASNELLLG